MCNQYTVMFVCDVCSSSCSIVVVVILRYEHYLVTLKHCCLPSIVFWASKSFHYYCSSVIDRFLFYKKH